LLYWFLVVQAKTEKSVLSLNNASAPNIGFFAWHVVLLRHHAAL